MATEKMHAAYARAGIREAARCLEGGRSLAARAGHLLPPGTPVSPPTHVRTCNARARARAHAYTRTHTEICFLLVRSTGRNTAAAVLVVVRRVCGPRPGPSSKSPPLTSARLQSAARLSSRRATRNAQAEPRQAQPARCRARHIRRARRISARVAPLLTAQKIACARCVVRVRRADSSRDAELYRAPIYRDTCRRVWGRIEAGVSEFPIAGYVSGRRDREAVGASQRFCGLRRLRRNVVLCHTPTRATAVAAPVAAAATVARLDILVI